MQLERQENKSSVKDNKDKDDSELSNMEFSLTTGRKLFYDIISL